MCSERHGSPEPLVRLADVLAKASGGSRPTPLELAELLWLARHMEPTAESPASAPTSSEDAGGLEATDRTPPPQPQDPQERQETPEPQSPEEPKGTEGPKEDPAPPPSGSPRAPLHLPTREGASGAPAQPHLSLLAPAPPMLHRPLALQRSLRPLKRRTPAPVGLELDERATADRIARLGAAPEWWLPVMRPAQERWLRLNLVYDAGPTMPVWRPLIRELHTVLAQSGVFRTVTLHRAEPDGTVRGLGAYAPADGRTVTLLISDCMGPQWRQGPAGTLWYGTLRRWAHRMSVAVVQPLPEHLWRDTALPAAPGRLSAPHPAAPTAALTFTPYDDTVPPETDGTVSLPVLEPGPDWLANWAALVAAPGGTELPASAARLSRPLPTDTDDRTDVAGLSAEDLVLRFRATASPEAFRLAGHLALGRPALSVMRLVHAALEPHPRPRHLAEVILSGMLTSVAGPPGSYEFRTGVRDLLLRGLPRTARDRTTELLARVGELIDTRAGRAPGEFRASTPAPSGERTGVDGEAFATVSAESVRRLSEGRLFAERYRLLSRLVGLDTHWLAEDTQQGGEMVVVRRYPRPPQWLRVGFMDRAQRLGRVRHPGIAAVRDYGVEGEAPYLIREFADGRSLHQRLKTAPHGLPTAELLALVPPLFEAVDALHTQAGRIGGLDASSIIITPRGPVLSHLDVMNLGRGSHAEDLRTLGHLVHAMHRGRDGSDQQQLPLPLQGLSPSEQLGEELDTAVAELISDEPDVQRRGADRLRGLPPHRQRTLTFSLLGPLRVTRNGYALPIDHPDEQAILCMLLLREGRPATRDELVAGLWDRSAPLSARDLFDTYVTRLRHTLGPDVLTVEGGYVLRLDAVSGPDDIDVVRFRRMATEAVDAYAAGELGRALDLNRSAVELWRGDPLGGVPGPAAERARAGLRRLHARLLERLRSTAAGITFKTTDLATRPEARITLEYAVHQILSRGDLTPRQYEVRVRRNGYVVHTEPDAHLLPVLVAVLRHLPEILVQLTDPPHLHVTFWPASLFPPAVRTLHDRTPAGLLVVVPPTLYKQFAASSAALGPQRFRPLYPDASDTEPIAWHCSLPLSTFTPVPEEDRDLVRGPFITHDLHQLGIPVPGRTAVVHTQPDGPLTLLNPVRPYGDRPPRPTTYYEVDLTTQQAFHRVSLPSSGKGAFAATVELSWHVDDPVTFVRGESGRISERLLDHLLEAAPRITRRHPLRRAGAAQRAVNGRLGEWTVPGLSVTCAVQLAPEGAPQSAPQRSAASPRRLPDVLAEAETVLLGFDGPLTRLYSARTAREAALDLLSVVAEHRSPEDALAGHPLPTVSDTGREVFVHPLDVLRAFAHDRLGPLLRDRLDRLELRALPDAPMTHNSKALVRALHDSGRGVHVATDVCEQAVHRYLEPYRLPLAGVHARSEDLSLLMPHPDCLLRALHSPATPASTGVVIGSTVAELTAAQQVGLRFIGLARNATTDQRLREAGCHLTVPSLAPVLEAARSL